MNKSTIVVLCALLGFAGCRPRTHSAGTPSPSPTAPAPTFPVVPTHRIVGQSMFYVPVSQQMLEKPIELHSDAGTFRQRVTTLSDDAQKYCNQGYAYLIGYDWVDASRSFHEALRRDGSIAVAWAGLALAYDGLARYDDASKAIDEAIGHAKSPGVTRKEGYWVRAVATKFVAMRQPLEKQSAAQDDLRAALDDLLELDKTDPNAWVWRGTAEEPGPWGRGQNGDRAAAVYYAKALELDPDHLGALHFQAHTLENLGRHEEAAALAERYAKHSPGIPHAHHMWAHSLPRLGRWEDAARTLATARKLHAAYFEEHGVPPETDWHYGHNLMVGGVVALRMGQVEEAERLFRLAYDLDYDGFYEALYDAPYLGFLLWKNDTKTALARAAEAEKSSSSFARLVGASVAGQAHVMRGDLEAARAAKKRFDEYYAQFEKDMEPETFAIFTPYAAHPHKVALEGMIETLEHPEAGTVTLLKLGDASAQAQSIDGWAQGLFLLDRIRKFAEHTENEELAAGMKRRIEIIDPDFFSIERESKP